MKKKKAAMEMSIGTIVTIVLLVSVLILGTVLISNIFLSAKGVVDLTDQQLRNEIGKLFSEENKLVIYPGIRLIEIKQGQVDGIGMGIKNLLTGSAGTKEFNYLVEVSDPDIRDKCGVTTNEAESWITTGREEREIPIPVGDVSVQKVLFDIPVGAPLCTIRYRINVDAEGNAYATDFFDVTIKAK